MSKKPEQRVIRLNRYQDAFLSAKEQYPGLFGGIGNGKTFAACVGIIKLATKYPDNLLLVGRLTYPELRDSTKEEFTRTLRLMYPDSAYVEKKGESSVTFWNKSSVIFRHLDNQAALLGPNLGGWYIDQAEEVDEEVYLTLQGRLRRQGIPELRGYITGNPRGHNWVYYRYGMHEGWNDQRHESDWKWRDNYRMITAPTDANAENLPTNYISQLRESYSDDWFNRYVLGSWDGFAGQIFNIGKIKGYDVLPKMTMVLTAVDPAISKSTKACNCAFETIGVGEDGLIYDIENKADNWSFLETLEEAALVVKDYKPAYLGVENVAYQSSLTEACQVHFPQVNVVNVEADKDKIRRAKSVSHIIEMGLFRTNNQELLNEMIAFEPDSPDSEKKDRVDALVHALHMVQKYAPIKSPAVKQPWDEYKGMDANQAWFKMTRDQAAKEMQQEDGDNIEEFAGTTIESNPDFY